MDLEYGVGILRPQPTVASFASPVDYAQSASAFGEFHLSVVGKHYGTKNNFQNDEVRSDSRG